MSRRVSSCFVAVALTLSACGIIGSDVAPAGDGEAVSATVATEPAGEASTSTGDPVEVTTPPAPSSTDTMSPSTTAPRPSTTTAATTTTAPTRVEDLPSGWFCRDLAARGYGYSDAVAYWVHEGSPDRMDADRNGIPCETVYPTADILAFWGDPLPTTTFIPAHMWIAPSDPWEYPTPVSAATGAYGSGCSPGTSTLPDGAWYGFTSGVTESEIEFDLACLLVLEPGECHPSIRNESPRLRTIGVAEGTTVRYVTHRAYAGELTYAEWRVAGCTSGVERCPVWLFVNGGVVTAIVENRIGH
jgi:hypothetical protein